MLHLEPHCSLNPTDQSHKSCNAPVPYPAMHMGNMEWMSDHSNWLWVMSFNYALNSTGLAKSKHYDDVIMGAVALQITSLTIVYSTVLSDTDQRKHQSSASLAFVRGIHQGPVNSPHKWPVSRKMFPFHDVIMIEGKTRIRNFIYCFGISALLAHW